MLALITCAVLHGPYAVGAVQDIKLNVIGSPSAILWETANTKLSDYPMALSLCFDYACVSHVPSSVLLDDGMVYNNTVAIVRVRGPQESYDGVFHISENLYPQISVWDFPDVVITVCRGVLYTVDPPVMCKRNNYAKAVCSGTHMQCVFEMVRGGAVGVAVLNMLRNITCTDTVDLVMASGDPVTVCAEEHNGVYEFNGVANGSMAVQFDGVRQIIYPDLDVHDTVQNVTFISLLVVALVVWTGVTRGGMAIGDAVYCPTKVQSLLIVDISWSILFSTVYAMHTHGLSLIPVHLSAALGSAYTSLIVTGYVLYQLMASLIAVSILNGFTEHSTYRAVILRHTIEMQIMGAIHMHFPDALGDNMRNLIALFVAVAGLVVCGRDARLLQLQLHAQMWQGPSMAFLLLVGHHNIVTGVYSSIFLASALEGYAAVPPVLAVSVVLFGAGYSAK